MKKNSMNGLKLYNADNVLYIAKKGNESYLENF